MPKINSFVFLDFETGGLDPRRHAIMEIAAIAIKGDTLEKIDLVSTYVKPYGKDEVTREGKVEREYGYDPEAMKSNGITFQDIEGGVNIQEAVNLVIELCKKADLYPGKGALRPIFFAHRSAFDKGFLVQMFEFAKKTKELAKYTYGEIDFYGNYQPEMIDTISFSKFVYGADEDMTNFKLQSCITKAGIELNDAHKAINDTIAMKDMIASFIGKLRSDGPTNEVKAVNRFRDHFQF
jgi:DNA polymerase III epsilon subunit-like protein